MENFKNLKNLKSLANPFRKLNGDGYSLRSYPVHLSNSHSVKFKSGLSEIWIEIIEKFRTVKFWERMVKDWRVHIEL